MRYQSDAGNINEDVVVTAKFLTGATVTVVVYNLDTGATVTLTAGTAAEIGTTGYFKWDSSDITTQPTDYIQYLVVFTDDFGQTAAQKIVKGGFPDQIAFAEYNGTVYVDPASGNSGTGFPNGTQRQPVDNIVDAKTIADGNGILTFNINGSITLDASTDYSGYRFIGNDPLSDTVALNSRPINGASFALCNLTGTQGTGDISCQQCLLSTVSGMSGVFVQTTFIGTITAKPSTILGASLFINCFSNFPGIGASIFDFNGTNTKLTFEGFTGNMTVNNMTHASSIYTINSFAGDITLSASNTAGTAEIHGDVYLTDSSTGTTVTNHTTVKLVSDGVENRLLPFVV